MGLLTPYEPPLVDKYLCEGVWVVSSWSPGAVEEAGFRVGTARPTGVAESDMIFEVEENILR